MKKWICMILSLLLTAALALPVSAKEGTLYIVDQMQAVTDSLVELNQAASDLSDQYGVNISCLLTETSGGLGSAVYTEQIYLGCYGETDGIMLTYCEQEQEWYIYKCGKAAEMFTTEDEDELWGAFASYEYLDECVGGYLVKAAGMLEEKTGIPYAGGSSAPAESGIEGTSPVQESKTEGTSPMQDPAESPAESETKGTSPMETIPDHRLQPRLVDDADLLTEAEENELLAKLDEISERQQCDVAVVTVPSTEGKTPMEFADDFYDYNGYGMGENADGILLLISMEDRDWWMSTSGFGITAFTDAGLEYISEKFLTPLSDGKYAQAFETYAKYCDEFLTQAKTGEAYDTGHMPKGTVAPIWILIDLAIGWFAAFIMASVKKNKLTTVRKKYTAEDYVVPGSLQLYVNTDRFITMSTTTRHIERDTSSSSGSSTHTSSSGSTHGGSGGKF